MTFPVGPEYVARPQPAVRGQRRGVLSLVRSMLPGLCLATSVLFGFPGLVLAQETGDEPPAAPVYAPDARTLTRVQSALETDALVKLDRDRLTFYLQITEGRPTFADYLRGTGKWFEISPIEPPSSNRYGSRLPAGAGIDLLSIFRSMNRALDERKARQIRQQIDRELDAIQGTKAH